MKAIVMAGGDGKRLQPLTEVRPKPMVEIFDKPVLHHTVEKLKKYGFTDILMTLRYLPKGIEDYFGDGSDFGVSIEHHVEPRALGTAGSVRVCSDFIGDEDVLIISGDAVCDLDLSECMRFHRERGAEATIVLFEHPEPTEYGLVITDEDGRVTAFSEKPSWERVTTNLVNTGIYILSPEVIAMIPDGECYDFGKDLFPRLLREDRRLYAKEVGNYWCDIGSPEAYRSCCMDALAGLTGIVPEAPEVESGVYALSPTKGAQIAPPVYVGEGCTIEPGAKIGPNAVISRGSVVRRGAVIKDSVVNGAEVGANARLEGCVVSRGAVIGPGAQVKADCVVGDRAVIGAGCVLSPGVRVWTEREAPEGRRVTQSIVGERPRGPVAISDRGTLQGRLGHELTPELMIGLGGCLGSKGPVGVAHTGGEGARLLSDALSCGVTGTGAECLRCDAEFEAELAGMCPLFSMRSAVFIREESGEMSATFLSGSGFAIPPALRRELAGAVKSASGQEGGRVGGITGISGLPRAYLTGILSFLKPMLGRSKPGRVCVEGFGAENRALAFVLRGLGFELTERAPGVAALSVSRGGFTFTAYDERGRRIDELHGAALAAEGLMRLGAASLIVPGDAPAAVRRLAVRHGCKLVDTPPEGAERPAAPFSQGVLAAASAMTAAAGGGMELATLSDSLPPFAVVTCRVDVACSRAKAMRLMAGSRQEMAEDFGGGLTYDTAKGHIKVSPSADGSALELRGEGADMEAARELCGEFERLARDVTGEK